MAETSGFFLANLVDGTYDRRYYARDFAAYFAKFIGNGIFADSKMLAVSQDAVPGMSVLVASGDAYINGYWYNNSESIDLALATADASLPRYDMVVLRLDMSARSMNLAVKTGTPASVPSAPSLSRTSDLYELGLAKIYVAAGATKIISSNITDLRLDNNYCGTVTGVVNQIDTTEYGSQLNNFIADYMSSANNTYEEFKASLQTLIDEFSANAEQQLQDEKSEFMTWFNTMKDKLSEDAAGNLQLEIDELKKETAVELSSYMTLSYDADKEVLNCSEVSSDVTTKVVLSDVPQSFTAIASAINGLLTKVKNLSSKVSDLVDAGVTCTDIVDIGMSPAYTSDVSSDGAVAATTTWELDERYVGKVVGVLFYEHDKPALPNAVWGKWYRTVADDVKIKAAFTIGGSSITINTYYTYSTSHAYGKSTNYGMRLLLSNSNE